MVRPPTPGPILLSQFTRDCSRPPFVGTNSLPPNLDPSMPLSQLYPALYASPIDGPGCVPSVLDAPYFGTFSPNMFIMGTWAMPDLMNATSGTIYAFGQNDICGGGWGSGGGGSVAGIVSVDGGTSYQYITGPDPAPGVFVSPTQSGVYNYNSNVIQYPDDPNHWYSTFLFVFVGVLFWGMLFPDVFYFVPQCSRARPTASGGRRTSPIPPRGAGGTAPGGPSKRLTRSPTPPI